MKKRSLKNIEPSNKYITNGHILVDGRTVYPISNLPAEDTPNSLPAARMNLKPVVIKAKHPLWDLSDYKGKEGNININIHKDELWRNRRKREEASKQYLKNIGKAGLGVGAIVAAPYITPILSNPLVSIPLGGLGLVQTPYDIKEGINSLKYGNKRKAIRHFTTAGLGLTGLGELKALGGIRKGFSLGMDVISGSDQIYKNFKLNRSLKKAYNLKGNNELYKIAPEYEIFCKENNLNPNSQKTLDAFFDKQTTGVRGMTLDANSDYETYMSPNKLTRVLDGKGGDRLNSKGLYVSNSNSIADRFSRPFEGKASSVIFNTKTDIPINKNNTLKQQLKQFRSNFTPYPFNQTGEGIVEAIYTNRHGVLEPAIERAISPKYTTTPFNISREIREAGVGRWGQGGVSYNSKDKDLFLKTMFTKRDYANTIKNKINEPYNGSFLGREFFGGKNPKIADGFLLGVIGGSGYLSNEIAKATSKNKILNEYNLEDFYGLSKKEYNERINNIYYKNMHKKRTLKRNGGIVYLKPF